MGQRAKKGIRLLNLMPVTAPGLATDEILDYMNNYLEEDTEVAVWQIGYEITSEGRPGKELAGGASKYGPYTIECEYDEALAGPSVLQYCKQAEELGFDAIFIDCFGDPAVKAARELVNIPVFGGFEPAAHIALGLADTACIVTVVSSVVPLIKGNVAKAHLDDRIVNVRAVDIPVDQLSDKDRLVDAIFQQSVKAIEDDKAHAIIMGCTGFVGVAEELKSRLLDRGYDVPVFEAAQCALKMLEVYAKMGFKQSRLTYMRPPVYQ